MTTLETINEIIKKLDELSANGVQAISFEPILISDDTKLDMINTVNHTCLTADIETDEWNGTDIELDELLDVDEECFDAWVEDITVFDKVYNILSEKQYEECRHED